MRARYSVVCAGVIVLACVWLSWRGHNEQQRLREEIRALKAQISVMGAQPIERAPDATTSAQPSSGVSSELLRLRSEVARLRERTNELFRLQHENAELRGNLSAATAVARPADTVSSQGPARTYFPKEEWTFAGFATPEAALQSTIWAMSQGRLDTFLASLSPEERAKFEKDNSDKTPAEFAQKAAREGHKIKGFHILGREAVSDDEVILQVFVDGESGGSHVDQMSLKRSGDEWKMAGKARKPKSGQ